MSNQNSEQRVDRLVLHPSILSRCFLLFSLLALLGTFIVGVGLTSEDTFSPEVINFIASIFIGLSLLILAFIARYHWNYKYSLCNDYVSTHQGVLSARLKTSRLFYHHIRGVKIEQSILGRILDFGDLRIESDISTGGNELLLIGVRHPVRIKEIIMERALISVGEIKRPTGKAVTG